MMNVSTLLCFVLFVCYTNLLVRGQDLQYKTIFQGYYSGIKKELKTIYRNNDEYNNFLIQHHSDSTGNFISIPPNINFDNTLIGALYIGTKNTGGYSVNITNVYIQQEDTSPIVIIEYITFEPGPYDIVTEALTQPHQVIEIGPLPDGVNQQNIDYKFQKMNIIKKIIELQFLITFHDNADPATVIQTINDNLLEYITNVQLLSAIGVGIINFNVSSTDAIDEETAKELLLTINGVKTVELDYIGYDYIPGDETITTTTIESIKEGSVSTTMMTIENNVEELSPLRFILTIDENTDINSVQENISTSSFFNNIISGIQLLSSIKMLFVDIDEKKMDTNKITKLDIQIQLQNIDGVNTVEEDGIVSINTTDEINSKIVEDEKIVDIISIDDNEINENMNDNVVDEEFPLRFILTIDENIDINSIEEQISSTPFFNNILSGIQLLSSVKMLFVDFDEKKMNTNEISKSDVQIQLENIDGVNTVEEDGIVSINTTDEMNSEITMGEDEIIVNENIDSITSIDEINENMNDNILSSDDKEDESSSFSLLTRMVSSLLLTVIVSVHVF